MNSVKGLLLILIIMTLFSARGAIAFQETLAHKMEGLEHALQIAERENPLIVASLERLEQARANVAIAESAMGPRVLGAFSAHWNDEKQIAPVKDLAGTLVGTALLEPQKIYAASLALDQVLYAGGSLKANKRAQRLALDAEIAVAERTYQTVVFHVRLAFYGYERARAQLTVAESAFLFSEEHLRQAEALHKNGMVSMGDVLHAKVVLSQAELEKIKAKNAVAVSWAQLERRVGASLERREARVQIDNARVTSEDIQAHLDKEVMALALSQRPEIKRFASQSKSAEEIARAERGKAHPQVVLRAEATQMGETLWPNQENNAALSLNLQWELYDHNETRARVSHAQSVAREFLSLLHDAQLQIKLEVKQALLQLNTAKTQTNVVLNQLIQAQEDFRIAQKRYQSHVGTHLDVLIAQDALVRSKAQRVDVFFDIAAAEASLAYAIGVDTPTKKSPEQHTGGDVR